jgi:hypothetical protein
MKACLALNARGRPCGSPAQHNGHYCFSHNLEVREDFLAASSYGGRSSPRRALYESDVIASGQARDALSLIVLRLLTGELDPRAAGPAIRAINLLTRQGSVGDGHDRGLPELTFDRLTGLALPLDDLDRLPSEIKDAVGEESFVEAPVEPAEPDDSPATSRIDTRFQRDHVDDDLELDDQEEFTPAPYHWPSEGDPE